MDFLFEESEKIDKTALLQGDVLHRTDELKAVLRQAHSYYADADDYTHFVVLTQSCELVRRGKSPPRSRYITIAAIRPLSVVLSRFFERHRRDLSKFGFPVEICNRESRQIIKDNLRKLLHSDHDDLFLIRAGSCPTILTDSCAFLHLSVALRADHYGACLRAKVGQMKDIFAAKLGELTGYLYARVATPELNDLLRGQSISATAYEDGFVDGILNKNTVWLSQRQFAELARILERRKANDATPPSVEESEQILSELPQDREFMVSRIVDILAKRKLLPDDTEMLQKARNLLLNDKELSSLLRSSP